MTQKHPFLVGIVFVFILLGSACCGSSPGREGPTVEPGLCSAAGILQGIQVTDARVSSVSQFACKHDHAFARATYTCEGCVPETMIFLAQKSAEWEVLGNSNSIDAGLCEESRALSFDECAELFEAFEAAGK